MSNALRPGPAAAFAVPLLLTLTSLAAACGPASDSLAQGAGDAAVLLPDAPRFSGVQGSPEATASSRFWDHWGDGRAEMSSYRVTISRYGEPRDGELVLIYVTEPHDRRTWIKDDDVAEPDRVEVLKLNASWKFLTGVYPYSVMTSVFSPVDDWGGARFRPVKVGLSVQEWCGNYTHQVWPGRDALRSLRLSYFAGQGERLENRDVPRGTLYEDGLLIQLRELDGAFAGGGDWEGWLMPSLWNVRRGLAPPEPVRATVSREASVAGDDDGRLTRFTLRYGDYTRTYDVEAAYPHRVLGWRTSAGDTVRLVETRRLAYWRLNDPDGRRHRAELGLDPRSSGLPPEPSGR